MPRPRQWSRDAVLAIAARQHGLITAAQLAAQRVPRSTVSRSDELGGMFSYVLPGVHRVDGHGPLSEDQQAMAAQLYAGPESTLTGTTVLRRYAVAAAARPGLGSAAGAYVLVPHRLRRVSRGFVRVERTVSMPRWREQDGLRLAVLPRAVMDAARLATDQDAVRALVFEVVQRGLVAPESLERERELGQRRGSRFARLALEEVRGGARSVAEGDVRQAFLAAGWDRLLLNPRIYLPDGTYLACPDVYDESGVCLEVDSREHHFAPDAWEATMVRHAAMTAAGLAVIHTAPRRFAADPAAVVGQFARAVDSRSGWPRPRVRVVPWDARNGVAPWRPRTA